MLSGPKLSELREKFSIMKLGITILRGNKIQLGKYQKEKIALEIAAKWKYERGSLAKAC